MRELKFRFWDALDEKMLNDIDIEEYTLHALRDFEGEILQYTGLKDKNGVEVYEGDILEMTFVNVHLKTVTERAFVKWNTWNWSLFVGDDDYYNNCSQILLNSRSPEVIGNIFQNPELLEVGK